LSDRLRAQLATATRRGAPSSLGKTYVEFIRIEGVGTVNGQTWASLEEVPPPDF